MAIVVNNTERLFDMTSKILETDIGTKKCSEVDKNKNLNCKVSSATVTTILIFSLLKSCLILFYPNRTLINQKLTDLNFVAS